MNYKTNIILSFCTTILWYTNATCYLKVINGLPGDVLTEISMEAKQFRRITGLMETIFSSHFKRTGEKSVCARQLYKEVSIRTTRDPAPLELNRILLENPTANVCEKSESECCYELVLVKSVEQVLSKCVICDREDYFQFEIDSPRFGLTWIYFRSHDIRKYKTELKNLSKKLPCKISRIFDIITNPIEGRLNISMSYQPLSRDGRVSAFLLGEVEVLAQDTLNPILEEVERIYANSIINYENPEKPDSPFTKLSLYHIMDRDHDVPECIRPTLHHMGHLTKFVSTPELWRFFELPDGLVEDNSRLLVLLDIQDNGYVEIRKSGLNFEVYPKDETQDSQFRVLEIYGKPDGPKHLTKSHSFYVVAYTREFGYVSIEGGYLVAECRDRKRSDLFGIDLSKANSLGSLCDLICANLNPADIDCGSISIYSLLYLCDGSNRVTLGSCKYSIEDQRLISCRSFLKPLRHNLEALIVISPATK